MVTSFLSFNLDEKGFYTVRRSGIRTSVNGERYFNLINETLNDYFCKKSGGIGSIGESVHPLGLDNSFHSLPLLNIHPFSFRLSIYGFILSLYASNTKKRRYIDK
jgi:hypothetical protein